MSEWVRRALHGARRCQPRGDLDSKLRAVRDATRHEFPSAGIDTMLAAIELGYAGSPRQ